MIEFHLCARGLGDAVCGYYAACGLANLGHSVHFHTRFPEWFVRVNHPGVSIFAHKETQVNGNVGYASQLVAATKKECPSRAYWYCHNIAHQLKMKEFEPSVPQFVYPPVQKRHDETGYVVLSPYSVYQSREWPIQHWKKLGHELVKAGLHVFAYAHADQETRLRSMFSGSGVRYWWGQDPDWVVDAILGSALLIGNDSGLVHVAGLHRKKAVVIAAQLSPEFVFRESRSVLGVVPGEEYQCRGCAWQDESGFMKFCDEGCSALMSIGANEVKRVALEVLQKV